MVSAHRLIFFAHHGREPEMIDHINRDKSDNRIANLRETTVSENRKNSAPNKGKACKGVYYNRARNRWVATIPKDGGGVRYGKSFETESEAIDYRVKAVGRGACF